MCFMWAYAVRVKSFICIIAVYTAFAFVLCAYYGNTRLLTSLLPEDVSDVFSFDGAVEMITTRIINDSFAL